MKKAVTVLVTVVMLFASTFAVNVSAYTNAYYYNNTYRYYNPNNYVGNVKPTVGINSNVNQNNDAQVQQSATQQTNREQSIGRSTVVAVMYHKISENPAEIGDFCISPETFEEDIVWFVDNGYSFCFASEVEEIITGRLPRGKYVAITFDDGYESDYLYALPILKKYNAQATFFVIGSGIGVDDRISEESLKLLASSSLVEIGTHSYELHNLSVSEMKKNYSANKISYIVGDFQKGAEHLEQITGKEVKTLSFPNGIWSIATVTELGKVGFDELFSSELIPIDGVKNRYGRVNRYSGEHISVVLKNHIS